MAAALPSLSMCPDGGLFAAWSSVHRRRGFAYRKFKECYGHADAGDLVWFAPSQTMNPKLPRKIIDQAIADDGARGRAEFLNAWRSDIESFIAPETVQSCVAPGVLIRPYDRVTPYFGFVDPSGGSVDGMTLCIGHYDYNSMSVIVDVLRERVPPFSPEQVTKEFCDVLKQYRIGAVTGDRYSAEWCVEQFRNCGITYSSEDCVPKSQLYENLMALLNSKRISLLDHPKAVAQICGLERRVGHAARAAIDHAPGGHDDCANAVAGLGAVALKLSGYSIDYDGWLDDDEKPKVDPHAEAMLQRMKSGRPWPACYDQFAEPGHSIPFDLLRQNQEQQEREREIWAECQKEGLV